MNQSAENQAQASPFALFVLGFRPFFPGAGAMAFAFILLWLHAYRTGASNDYYGFMVWHGHEMIFGYTAAVVAGFLLTAVRNWTDLPTLHGKPLAALTLLWLAGRVLPFFSLPHLVIALVDLAFLPILAIALAIPILKRKQTRNMAFLPIFVVFIFANCLVHFQVLGLTGGTARGGLYLALNVILVIIAIVAGRVLPFFTQRALGINLEKRQIVEILSFSSLVAFSIAELLVPGTWLITVLATATAVCHGIRLAGWHTSRLWSVPLLWVLFLGYAWLVLGFVLKACASAGFISPFLHLHAFATGCFGVLTLGMMVRVSLGHTGRPLIPDKPTILAFVLINMAALVRVILPIFFPGRGYGRFVEVSGGLWALAFLLFVIVYTPICIKPRPDGQPG